MDKRELDKLILRKTKSYSPISIGVTWVDGRAIWRVSEEYRRNGWYGICHFSECVFAVTPLDYDVPTFITEILVSPEEDYCNRAYSCLDFTCKLNRFNKGIFLGEFKKFGVAEDIPRGLGKEPLWFSERSWKEFWKKFILPVEGGRINYSEEKAKALEQEKGVKV